jgi:hypothetical protein
MTLYQEGLQSARRVALLKARSLRLSSSQTWSSDLIKEQKQQALACRTLAEIFKKMIKR